MKLCRVQPARSRLALAFALAMIAASSIGAAARAEIVEPTGNPNPEYSKAREPDAQALIETWRSSNKFMTGKHVERERFEILDRRIALGGAEPRAFLEFRILSPQGDALSFAAARCPGRRQPIEIQVFYQWSSDLGAWVAQGARGDGNEDLCSGGKLWSADQIDRLVNPPPLPAPPRISKADVKTPPPGSPERAAIMNALRPRYEALFGAPIVFKVETLRVAAGFAFVVMHPERPNGAPIDQATWRQALGEPCFQNPAGVEHEYWMKRQGEAWTIGVKNAMCADDSISREGDLIGAPALLIGEDSWPEREFPPELQ
jgi:hypothetical protein